MHERNAEQKNSYFEEVTRNLQREGLAILPEQDGFTPVYHTDRKLLQKLREKKIAHGHKPDDHAPEMRV